MFHSSEKYPISLSFVHTVYVVKTSINFVLMFNAE